VEGLSESLPSPWWFYGHVSRVALVLKEKEHSEPMAGRNVILLQPFGLLLI